MWRGAGGAPALPVSTYQLLRPDCGFDVRTGVPFRAFLLRDSPASAFALWRCAPCTRYKVQAIPAGDGMFACALSNGAPLQELFTDSTLAQSFPYLYSAEALQAMPFVQRHGGGFVVAAVVFPQNESTVLQVRSELSDMGALGTLTFWGGPRYASDTACAQPLRMHECGAFSGGFDPTRALQQERSILQKALANPSLPFTMTCEGQQYTSRSQDTCNPNIDKRRQVLLSMPRSHST